eukprot:3766353-Pleurochrysis_carterae.AAC.1
MGRTERAGGYRSLTQRSPQHASRRSTQHASRRGVRKKHRFLVPSLGGSGICRLICRLLFWRAPSKFGVAHSNE